LIEFVTTNKATRREDWYTIPAIIGWDCGYEAIANVIGRKGYAHALPLSRPTCHMIYRRITNEKLYCRTALSGFPVTDYRKHGTLVVHSHVLMLDEVVVAR
jgi:hypothetical protein